MKKVMKIEGMSCEHCIAHVKAALIELGAGNVEVSLESKEATACIPSSVDDSKIREIIEDAGYEVVTIENR